MYDKQNRTEILFWFLWILISCYNSHLPPWSTKIPLLCCSYDGYRNHISPELKLSIPPCYWTCLTTTTSPHPYPKLFLFALVYVAIFPFSFTTLDVLLHENTIIRGSWFVQAIQLNKKIVKLALTLYNKITFRGALKEMDVYHFYRSLIKSYSIH